MAKFSKTSKDRLSTCHPLLQKLFNKVILFYDCTIVQGYRGQEDQDKAFSKGKSKLKWPDSKHNSTPSMAVDVAPFINGQICWEFVQMTHFAGFVLGLATEIGINIRWGGDWNRTNNLAQNKFNDLPHFELKI